MKACTKCGERKPLSEFHNHRNTADLKHLWCKLCRCAGEKARRDDPATRATWKHLAANDMRWRAREALRLAKKRAKAQGVKFDISDGWLVARLEHGFCQISGLPFVFDDVKSPYRPSIDRQQAGGGYVEANCRLVILGANWFFFNYDREVMLEICRAIAEKNPR